MLERAERVAHIGSWEFAPETGEIWWSNNMYRLFGFEPAAVRPTPEIVWDRIHPDDLAKLQSEAEKLRSGRLDNRVEFRIVLPDGRVRHMRSWRTRVPSEGGRPELFAACLQDITDERRAEREIAAHVAVTEALIRWESLDAGGSRLLCELGRALGCGMGVFWLPVGGMLEARVCWNEPRHDHMGLEESARERRYARGDGLPGRAWAEREPVAETKPESDMPGAIAFPILSGAEVMAVIELRALEDPGLSERLRRSLIGIGHELGQFLARHRADLEPPALTPRELEVVQLAAQGDSVRGIAERLVLSPATVKTHLEHVYAKLGAPDRAAAVATALRRGLIE